MPYDVPASGVQHKWRCSVVLLYVGALWWCSRVVFYHGGVLSWWCSMAVLIFDIALSWCSMVVFLWWCSTVVLFGGAVLVTQCGGNCASVLSELPPYLGLLLCTS